MRSPALALPETAHGLPAWRRKDIDLLRRLLVVGYLVAAATGIFAVSVDGSDHGNAGLLVLACLEVATALLLAVRRAPPAWAIKAIGFWGAILLVSCAVVLTRPLGPTPLYYLWPALNCGYFGDRRDARIASMTMAASFALALVFAHDVQVPLITYTSVVSIFLVVLLAVQLQARRTDRLLEELAYAAATDGLTGLLDRRSFNEAFAREVERARSSGLALSLVFFDLDHFKSLNDGFGHPAGDEALRAFARILAEQCSVADVVARMGGEEFAVLLFGADAEIARDFATRIAAALAQWGERHPPALTTSAGSATFGGEIATPSDMLRAADRALCAAKASGRNRLLAAGQTRARVLVAA